MITLRVSWPNGGLNRLYKLRDHPDFTVLVNRLITRVYGAKVARERSDWCIGTTELNTRIKGETFVITKLTTSN